MGLAIASDLGIALQTVTLAVLLHRRRMVSLVSLDYAEMGRCLVAALASGGGVWLLILGLGGLPGRFGLSLSNTHLRAVDLGLLAIGTALWLAVARWVLEKTGSALPRVTMKRLGLSRGDSRSYSSHRFQGQR